MSRINPTDDLESITHEVEGGTRVWEEYEEAFADDPFSFYYNELARLTGHVLGLKHQLDSGQQERILRLWTYINIDLWAEPALLDYELVAKHYDAVGELQWKAMVKQIYTKARMHI